MKNILMLMLLLGFISCEEKKVTSIDESSQQVDAADCDDKIIKEDPVEVSLGNSEQGCSIDEL